MFAFLGSARDSHLILVVVLVLFGGAQLPKLAKNLGKAQKEFKDGWPRADKSAERRQSAVTQVDHLTARPSDRRLPRSASAHDRRSAGDAATA